MTEPRKRGRPPKQRQPLSPKQPKSMTSGQGPSPVLSVRLPPHVHEKLKAFAEDRGHPTLSAAGRDIIEIWLVDFEPGK